MFIVYRTVYPLNYLTELNIKFTAIDWTILKLFLGGRNGSLISLLQLINFLLLQQQKIK